MSPSLTAIPGIDAQLAADLSQRLEHVETRLREVVDTEDAIARLASRHLIDAGGKRIRPTLTLLAASFGDADSPGVIDAAALVELTHLATLYHDDVMDDAGTRRGTRAVHRQWDNIVAILTGDFLLARASAMSARLGSEAVLVHSATFERLCLGQLRETVGPQDGEDPFAHYLSVLADKTASLIGTAGELGAMFAGTPQTATIMRDYGEKVGVAFQLADDVIDLSSDPAVSGKTPGTDLREGVPTMPTLLVRQRAQEGDDTPHTRKLMGLLDGDLSDDSRLAEAVELLRRDQAVDKTLDMATALADEAVEILHSLDHTPARDALEIFTRALVHRGA